MKKLIKSFTFQAQQTRRKFVFSESPRFLIFLLRSGKLSFVRMVHNQLNMNHLSNLSPNFKCTSKCSSRKQFFFIKGHHTTLVHL